uniref:Golgin subfamily A member 1-like n=1 Tax=Phallusia mammillata TaxID=59560 RepID=A0A6F9DDS4_9ASCI|nr:golgin subfamily A member 1-like [Phallusia mammillata]
MFKKLRQRLETEEATSPGKDGTNGTPNMSRRYDEGRRPSNSSAARGRITASNLFRSDSLSSLNGSENEMPTDSSSKEDLYTMLMNRTTQVKRMEVKLAEYGQSLKERTKECEKLSSALEKQQDNALRKLNELNDTYSKDKDRYETTICRLEESESSLSNTKTVLEEENERLKSALDDWEKQKEEFNQTKTEFYEKRDNSEELHDLQRQEMAKLKHMLMNSEKESKRLQIGLDEHMADLIQTREKNDELEAILRKNTEDLKVKESALREIENERNKLKDDKEKNESLIKKLTSNNNNLKDKLSCLALDLQKTRSSLSTVENRHSSLSEKYDSLKHSCEAVMSKSKTESEERQSLIDHLQSKLQLMEKRSGTHKLPQDEQMQAFLAERAALETKLEESHQQLVNIKSTWSDKINHLENQVSHLNSKIAEDCQEISQKTSQLKESQEKIASLTGEIATLKEDADDLTSHNETYLQQVAELEAKLIEKQTLHDIELGKSAKLQSELEEKLCDKRKSHLLDIEKFDKTLLEQTEDIANLKASHCLEINAYMEKMTSLEEEIKKLQEDLENKNSEISSRERINSEMAISLEEVRSDREDLKKKVAQMEENLNSNIQLLEESKNTEEQLREELSSTQGELSMTQQQLSDVTQRFDEAQAELSKKSEGLLQSHDSSQQKEETLRNLELKVEDLQSHLGSRTEELMHCKEEIANLKNNQAEEGEEVKMLRIEKSTLEDRVLEKDRSLKLNQQRLVDLKKALQKELNKQGAATSVDRSRSERRRSSSRPGKGSLAASNDTTNHRTVAHENGVTPEAVVDPIPSLLAGDMALDDPSLNDGQRDVVIKYLKHVVLRFLSCGQSEAQQLVKAISMILKFTKDEENLVKEVLEYRTSWFGSRPSTKNVIKPSFKGKSRHKR